MQGVGEGVCDGVGVCEGVGEDVDVCVGAPEYEALWEGAEEDVAAAESDALCEGNNECEGEEEKDAVCEDAAEKEPICNIVSFGECELLCDAEEEKEGGADNDPRDVCVCDALNDCFAETDSAGKEDARAELACDADVVSEDVTTAERDVDNVAEIVVVALCKWFVETGTAGEIVGVIDLDRADVSGKRTERRQIQYLRVR